MIDYKKMKCWREAHELTLSVLRFLNENDLNKNYRLKDQLQGSLISIGSNLAEGSKGSNAELRRYMQIAINSATESEYQIIVLRDMNLISEELYAQWQSKLNIVIGSMINYRNKIKV